MPLSLRKIENQTLSDGTSFVFDFDDTLQQSIVGLAYFKLSYGSDHSYELNKMALSLSNTPNTTTSIKTTVAATLEDDDHTIDLSDSVVSLSAIGVVGSSQDFDVKMGSKSNIESGSGDTKICDSASDPVQTFAAMMSGFSMGYSSGIHRFWYAQTKLSSQIEANDGLYASVSGYCEDDDNNKTDDNSFDLVAINTSTAETPPLLIRTWKGQETADGIKVDFSDLLEEGKVIGDVRVFISDFYVIYADGGIGSSDHEITAVGAGCVSWSGAGETEVTLNQPYAFVYQTGSGHDIQDNDASYVELVIIATQRPA